METPATIPTIWDRTATTLLIVVVARVRWAILRRTDMGYTTWQGISMSGVGIGMGRRMDNRLLLIQPDPQLGASVLCAAAFGSTTQTSRGAPIAAASASRRTAAMSGSVV